MYRCAYFYASLNNLTLMQSLCVEAHAYFAARWNLYHTVTLEHHTNNNCKHILWRLLSPFNLFHCALSDNDSCPFLLSQALRTNDCIVTRQKLLWIRQEDVHCVCLRICFQAKQKQKRFKRKSWFVFHVFVTNCWTTNSDTPPWTNRMRLTWLGFRVL